MLRGLSVLKLYGIDITEKSNLVKMQFSQKTGDGNKLVLELAPDRKSWFQFQSKITINQNGKLFQREFDVNFMDIIQIGYWMNKVAEYEGGFKIPINILKRNFPKDFSKEISYLQNDVDSFNNLDAHVSLNNRLTRASFGQFINMDKSRCFWFGDLDDCDQIFYQIVLFADMIFCGELSEIQLIIPGSAILEILRALFENTHVELCQFIKYVTEGISRDEIHYDTTGDVVDVIISIFAAEGAKTLKKFNKSVLFATETLQIIKETNQFIDDFGWVQLTANN